MSKPRFRPPRSPRWRVILLAGSTFIGTALITISPPPAAADEIDDLRSKARGLVEELEDELEAVRAERRRLETERRELEAERQRLEAERKALAAEQAPGAAPPVPPPPAVAETPAETERKVAILTDEVERLKERIVLPETKEYKSYYGLGPAASKIYQMNRGLSIGGYGEGSLNAKLTDRDDNDNRADFLRFVLYTGYKFTDRLLLNAELELEHATTASTVSSSDGSFSLEFAYLDYLHADYLNFRGGLVLVPLGFINEIHEPVFFHGNNRPEVERQIIPTTWRELGAGVFGNLHPDLAYRAYVTTSLDAQGFSESGIRGGRQSGNRVLAEDPAGSVRLDYTPRQVPGLLVGSSAFFGNTGQDQNYAGEHSDAFLTLWDVHAQYRYRGLELRALAAFGNLGDAASLSRAADETIADRFDGWYGEVAYDVMPLLFPQLPTQALSPFFRYEHYDTQEGVPSGFVRDLSREVDLYTLGVGYKPHPQVVLKLDYRNFVPRRGNFPDDLNVGLGFIF